jgi:molybdopterin/thiamine biosynthesis adenylyltransferase
MIIIDANKIKDRLTHSDKCSIQFRRVDDGDVYSMFHETVGAPSVPGSLTVVRDIDRVAAADFGKEDDWIRIAAKKIITQKKDTTGLPYILKGWVQTDNNWELKEVYYVSLGGQLFSRFSGIMETDVLIGKPVLIIGVGSFGSMVAALLTQSGVTDFILLDDDRLEVGNIMRHWAGVSDLGRYKTKAVKALILNKNPSARVTTVEKRVEDQTISLVEELVAQADVVVCLTDDRDSRLIVNRICLQKRKVCFFSGAYRRAYGGRVQRVRPYESACYQCFLMSLPDEAANEEVSNKRQSDDISYSDETVPVEPGLANDIAPMVQMLSKQVIQELLKDKPTTLRSLDEDLSASVCLWFNRREAGTDQENWEPLEFNIDGFHVMRWYGAFLPRHENCPACGDHLAGMAKRYSMNVPKPSK